MKKLLSRLIYLPIGVVMVLFLVSNRQLVAISLDPFSTEDPMIATYPLPLWIWLVVIFLAGYFLGASASWVSGRKRRKADRANRKELHKLRRDMEAASTSNSPPSGETLPTLKAS